MTSDEFCRRYLDPDLRTLYEEYLRDQAKDGGKDRKPERAKHGEACWDAATGAETPQGTKQSAVVNMRIHPLLLDRLKSRAREHGVGYQTLIKSVLHRFVEGRLVEYWPPP
jgi:hypothetical protein